MVQNAHKKVRHIRHGPDLEEMGGTKIDQADSECIPHQSRARLTVDFAPEPTKKFLEHYLEEIREQLRVKRK